LLGTPLRCPPRSGQQSASGAQNEGTPEGASTRAFPQAQLAPYGSRRSAGTGAARVAAARGEDAIPATAVFVANWHEEEVLRKMVEGNLACIQLAQVSFVLGVYPNDGETLRIAKELERQYPARVRVIVNRLPGPTSKGQMLNEMFCQVFRGEDGPELAVLHDSEDVSILAPFTSMPPIFGLRLHSGASLSLSRDRTAYVASTYMDEFAERHTRELIVRNAVGAAIPSASVGTCLSKKLIKHFLATRGQVLMSGTVTEDSSSALRRNARVLRRHSPQSRSRPSRASILSPPGNSFNQVSNAYADLQRTYNGGVLQAPVSGHVGSKVAMVGEVLSASKDEVARLHTGHSFALAYIPEGYLFELEEGQKVAVKARGQVVTGHVERVLPVTKTLPPEFQLPNKVRGRGQLVRVTLAPEHRFAVAEKIQVTGCYLENCRLGLGDIIRQALPHLQEVGRKLGPSLAHLKTLVGDLVRLPPEALAAGGEPQTPGMRDLRGLSARARQACKGDRRRQASRARASLAAGVRPTRAQGSFCQSAAGPGGDCAGATALPLCQRLALGSGARKIAEQFRR
jgi:Glycosyltransferase like family 2/HlyD family secretion protein